MPNFQYTKTPARRAFARVCVLSKREFRTRECDHPGKSSISTPWWLPENAWSYPKSVHLVCDRAIHLFGVSQPSHAANLLAMRPLFLYCCSRSLWLSASPTSTSIHPLNRHLQHWGLCSPRRHKVSTSSQENILVQQQQQ